MSELDRPIPEKLGQKLNRTSRLRGGSRLWGPLAALLALGVGAGIYTQITAPEPYAVNSGVTWKAWLSDDTIPAASRLNHNNGPYVRLDGVVVANNWTDLTDGTLQNPIRINENGADQYNRINAAWTSTGTDGSIITPTCSNWTDGSYRTQGILGGMSAMNTYWTEGASATSVCSNRISLYCIGQEPVHLRRPSRVFVTEGTYNGNLGGLAGADAKCQASAEAAGLK